MKHPQAKNYGENVKFQRQVQPNEQENEQWSLSSYVEVV